MQRIIGILIVVGIFSLISAEAQEKNDSIPNYLTETENYDSLLVFIGTKVRIHEYKVKADKFHIAFDRAFKAKYKVLEVVHGEYQESLIEFNVFDHYGRPSFSNYKYVMLFVNKNNGVYIHEKYQFFDMYRTVDNKWASPYASYDYNHSFNTETEIKPEKIEFSTPIKYDISDLSKEQINECYPKPYFRFEHNKAIAIYGNYIEELYKLKRFGVLKARETPIKDLLKE